MTLVPRGVWRVPYLTAAGAVVMVAVNFQSRLVASRELAPDDNPYSVTAELWQQLDEADPEHSRRVALRDLMQPEPKRA